MSKLIELGVASRETRQTEPGVAYDGRVDPIPALPGLCKYFKIFDDSEWATPADIRPCTG